MADLWSIPVNLKWCIVWRPAGVTCGFAASNGIEVLFPWKYQLSSASRIKS